MKHILVPVGSTENASNTMQYAIDFAAKFDAKVLFLEPIIFKQKRERLLILIR